MPSDRDLRQVQETELESLRAIFGDDFDQIRTRSTAKALATPFEFRLKIRTEEVELQDKVRLDLRVRLPRLYPSTRPTLVLEGPVGLSPEQVSVLRERLNAKANELIGSEMLYDLAMFVGEYITEHNTVVPAIHQPSLIEERQTRAFEAKKQQEIAVETERARQLALKSTEHLEWARQIQQDIDTRRQLLQHERDKAHASDSQHAKPSASESDESLTLPRSPINITTAAGPLSIHLGFEIPHASSIGKVYDARVPLTGPARLTIVQLHGRYYQTPQGKKMLMKVLSDLDRVGQLSHSSIQAIYGSELADNKMTIVSEPLPSTSMQDLLNQCGTFTTSKALECLEQLLSALSAIHQAHLVHRAIKPQNVFLYPCQNQADKSQFKLANVSWFQRLCDLCKSNPFCELPVEAQRPDLWVYPNTLKDPLAYDRERDLFDLGVTFAFMLFGELWPRWESPAEFIQTLPSGFPSTCREMLESTMLNYKKTSAQRLADRLANVNKSPSTAMGKSHHSPNPQTLGASPSNQGTPQGVFWQPQAVSYSRYRNDFDEVQFLGQGGFGEVVKARNKLDHRFYAVKKIPLPTDPREETKILREVTILSRMSHPHIVRYFSCWIEETRLTSSSNPELSHMSSDISVAQSPNDGRFSKSPSKSSITDGNTSLQPLDQSSSDDDDDDDDDAADNTTIHEFEFGFDDLDLLSCHPSNSMLSIRFGDSSHSHSRHIDDASAQNDDDKAHSSPPKSAGSEGADKSRLKRTLFMQMEFVDSLTLREAIDQGIESEREVWKISRQILSAMVYFTALNVIHRDLKPSNIFLDAKGDVRIGDFGLAVNQIAMEVEGPSKLVPTSSELTTGVGTAHYIAPETENNDGRQNRVKYLEKIDVYSFGIVLFEMLHRMETAHERMQTIKDLRSAEIKFPSNWNDEPNGTKTRIIKWCLNHTAELRPSPTELLKSHLFPPPPEDENIEEITRLISHPDHAMFRPYLASLFDQPLPDRLRRDFTYDFHTADTSQRILDNPYRTLICDHLTQKFRQRGAVNVESPVLLPYTDIDHPFPVKLLDSEGTVVTLHFDVTIPFARTVARDESLIRLKRFTFAPIYRQNPAGGQPVTIPVASYDIVSPIRTLAAESEVIQLADDILHSLPLGTTFEHILSHNKLWDAIFFDLPNHHRDLLQKMLEKYNSGSPGWSELSKELLEKSRISRPTLESIRKTFDIRGDIDLVSAHLLSSNISLHHKSIIQEALEDLEQVIRSAKSIGIQGSIVIWPMLVPQHRDDSNGVFFNTYDARKRRVLAAGGRFDGLVQKLTIPGAGHQIRSHLVSVSLHISRLSLTVARHAQISITQSWRPRRCDVYVMSFTPHLLKERLEVIRELWNSGISADLMYDGEGHQLFPEEILQSCRKEGIIFAVIVKAPNPHKDQIVKVKSLAQRTEYEVSLRELAVWLEDALQEYERAEPGTINFNSHQPKHNPKGKANAPNQLSLAEPSSVSRDYVIILPDDASRKMKHKSRLAVYDKALEAISENMKILADAPIFVFDLEDPPFNKLFQELTWIDSAEVYRKQIADLVPTSRKTYVWEIRDIILSHKRQSPRPIWIYNLRTNHCRLLTIPQA